MSRNGSGSYTLPATVNPVVDATTITVTWANTTLDDIATELTASLDRNGKGGMLAPLRCADGSVAAPAYAFTADTDTGFYRIGANNLGLAIGGTKILDINGTTATVVGTLAASAASITGDAACGSATVTNDTSTGGDFIYAAAKTYQHIISAADMNIESAASSTLVGNDATAADIPELQVVGDTAYICAAAHLPAGATVTAVDAYYALNVTGAGSLTARARVLTPGGAPANVIAPNTAVAYATIAGGWHSLGAATTQSLNTSGGSEVEVSLRAVVAGFPDFMDLYAIRITYTLQTIRP